MDVGMPAYPNSVGDTQQVRGYSDDGQRSMMLWQANMTVCRVG